MIDSRSIHRRKCYKNKIILSLRRDPRRTDQLLRGSSDSVSFLFFILLLIFPSNSNWYLPNIQEVSQQTRTEFYSLQFVQLNAVFVGFHPRFQVTLYRSNLYDNYLKRHKRIHIINSIKYTRSCYHWDVGSFVGTVNRNQFIILQPLFCKRINN